MNTSNSARVVKDHRGQMVVQRKMVTEGKFGATNPKDSEHWVTVYTVAQCLSPTFSRICNK